MLAENLRNLTEAAKQKEGISFWDANKDELILLLEKEAKNGKNELRMTNQNPILNKKNWLSKPHLYKSLMKELKSEGLQITHSDDIKDGTYMIIRW